MPKARLVAFRKGSTRIEVENEGRFVLLYDESSRAALKESRAHEAVLDSGAAREAERDAIARRGSLVVYQVDNDAPVRVEAAVGPPLSDQEKGGKVKWLERQQALLSLPSGALCVETAPSCRLLDEEPEEEGGRFEVPPGDYVLSLDRIAPADLGDGPRLPTEVLTLTPKGELEAPTVAAFLSLWDALGERPLPPAGTATDGRFEGTLASTKTANAIANLDESGLAALGIRFGTRLEVRIGAKGDEVAPLGEAAWIGNLERMSFHHMFGLELDSVPWIAPPPHFVAWIATSERAAGRPVLHLGPGDLVRADREGLLKFIGVVPMRGIPFGLRVLESPCLPTLDPVPGTPAVEGRTLRCTLLIRSKQTIVLGAGRRDLEGIGVGPGATLAARFPDGPERSVLFEVDRAVRDAARAAALEPSREDAARLKALEKKKNALMRSIPAVAWEHPKMVAHMAQQTQIDDEVRAITYAEEKRRRAPFLGRVVPHFEGQGELLVLTTGLPLVAGPSLFAEAAPGSVVELTAR